MEKLIDITGKALSGEWGTNDETGNGIPVLRTTNFTNEGVVNYKDVVTRTITKKNIGEKFLRKGDIIIEKSGGSDKFPVGRVIYFDGDENTYLFNNFTGLLRVKNQDVWYPKYVFYSLFANYKRGGTRAFENKTTGLHNLKTDDYVSRYEIAEIDMKEQISICEKLDKLYGVIKLREQELQLLDDLIKARFVELFECGDHEIVKVSDVCDFITKGTTPPTGEITEEYENGKIPFLKVYNLSFTGEMLFDENPQYILAETHNGKLARSKVYPNDVLMNIVGPPLGKFTLVTDEFEEWNINQAIAIFRAKERILPRFLLHALMQPKVLEPFIGRAVGIRQQNLSLEQCRNLQFPLPSLEEQKSFVEFAEQLDKSKVAVQKALDETQVLFDSLMQEYFG